MKQILYILVGLFLISCTSNTIYKKPENLISKDTMVMLLKDMYIANSAKNFRNFEGERYNGYIHFIYDKYKIDSTRFTTSNIYYTTQIVEYEEILKQVQTELDTLVKEKREEYEIFKDKPTELKDIEKLKEF